MVIKLGLVGCGNVVQRSHISAYKSLQELVSVEIASDTDINKARVVNQELCAEITTNYTELFKRDLDCIIVAVPIGLSSQINLEVLKHRIPLITEKPGASNHVEAAQLVVFAREKQVPFTFVQNYLYGTRYLQATRNLERVGEITYVRLESPNAGYGSIENGFDMGWRCSPKLTGGRGCFLNHGFHEVYTMLHLNPSPPERVFAVMRDFHYRCGIEDFCKVVVQHINGSITEITTGFLHHLVAQPIAEVHGMKGSVNLLQPAEYKTKNEFSHTRFLRERFTELASLGRFKDVSDEFLLIHRIIDACYVSARDKREVMI